MNICLYIGLNVQDQQHKLPVPKVCSKNVLRKVLHSTLGVVPKCQFCSIMAPNAW